MYNMEDGGLGSTNINYFHFHWLCIAQQRNLISSESYPRRFGLECIGLIMLGVGIA